MNGNTYFESHCFCLICGYIHWVADTVRHFDGQTESRESWERRSTALNDAMAAAEAEAKDLYDLHDCIDLRGEELISAHMDKAVAAVEAEFAKEAA